MFQPSIWRREEHQDSKVTRSSDTYVHVTDLLSSSREDVTYAESRRHDPCPEEENLFYWFMANSHVFVGLFVGLANLLCRRDSTETGVNPWGCVSQSETYCTRFSGEKTEA